MASVQPDPETEPVDEQWAVQEDLPLTMCCVRNADAASPLFISSGWHLRASLGILRRDDQTDVLEAKSPLSKATRLQVGILNKL